jgi:3-phenylpropionate/trans-cinnamate dioxygenase ferredoxin reductase subunit
MPEHFIIVGAGQAAAQAVQTLRQKGFGGRITIVGEERDPPYQRPPLSKKYLAGELARERLFVKPREFYAQRKIDLELGMRAQRLEPSARRVVLEDGRALEYDGLMLATGSRVRKLAVPGAELGGIHYVRTLADVDAIRDVFRAGKRLVGVGAGYIGLEVAAVAATGGLTVTVLEAAERVMARVVCPEVSQFYHRYHTSAGVQIHCDTSVSAFTGENRLEAVETSGGRRFPCDLAIIGIGVTPNVELAEAAGLECDDGIVVDEFARTANPSIVAAGDCTRHPSALAGHRIRLESVPNAIEQAKTAALSLLGEPKAYATIPWFWSDQYDLKLQIAGLSAGHDRVVMRRETGDDHFSVFYLRSGAVVAVDAVNRPKDFLLGRKLIAAGAVVPPEVIADPGMDLAAVARALG